MSDLSILAVVCGIYFAIVVGIGVVAYRRTPAGAEEYFLGGRTARTVVLFMALFGTNVTPFVLMGIPGLAYHDGIGVFGLNAAIVALGIPLTFWLIGDPAWRAARRIGAISPAELFAERFASPLVGRVLFAAFVLYTLPYMVTSVLGVGLAVTIFTGGAVSFAVAAAALLLITLGYTSAGGMRATMWTNVFQGTVFLGFVVVAFVWIAADYGGLPAAMARVQAAAPQLLTKADRPMFAAGAWASWGLAISLTVIAFPHMLVRIFAARDVTALKNSCRLYPPALIALWLPAVLFGVWGAVEFPGLAGRASDSVFPRLVAAHLPVVGQGVALAGILAAVMSTIDAQFLTLSSMLIRDVVRPGRSGRPPLSEARQVRLGRLFVVALAAVTYGVALWRPASIFSIASFSFSGYVTLIPTLLLGLHWRRMSATAAIASIVAGNMALGLAALAPAPPAGVLPVAWGLATGLVVAILLGHITEPTDRAVVDRVLGEMS
jgi:SSS family solute:Na+ symporter